MFEKEAEEIVKRNVCGDCNKCQSHGYIGCDIYRYSKDSCLYGLRTGYNKANEWHFVKDELPPIKEKYCGRSELVLVLSKEKEMQYAQYVEKEKTWARGICEINFKPYAWKEIVLPELKESE